MVSRQGCWGIEFVEGSHKLPPRRYSALQHSRVRAVSGRCRGHAQQVSGRRRGSVPCEHASAGVSGGEGREQVCVRVRMHLCVGLIAA